MDSSKDAIKAMIELPDTWEEADEIIEEFAGITELRQKLGYVMGMLDVSVVCGAGGSSDRNDYTAMLSAVVNKKWR
jgi:hypothetical protein